MVQSEDELLRDIKFDFTDEEILEANEKKAGRPNKKTSEIRARIREANDIKFVLQELKEALKEFKPPQPNPSPNRTANRNQRGIFSQLLKGDIRGLEKIIEESSEEAISTAIKKGAPIIGALAGVWLAESKVKGFPRVLHTGVDILNMIILVLNAILDFIRGFGEIAVPTPDTVLKDINNILGLGRTSPLRKKQLETVAQNIIDAMESGDTLAAAVEANKHALFGFKE